MLPEKLKRRPVQRRSQSLVGSPGELSVGYDFNDLKPLKPKFNCKRMSLQQAEVNAAAEETLLQRIEINDVLTMASRSQWEKVNRVATVPTQATSSPSSSRAILPTTDRSLQYALKSNLSGSNSGPRDPAASL